jgi:ABC-2 type transport system ATP-binding protein
VVVAQGTIDQLVGQFFPTARVQMQVAAPPDAVTSNVRRIPGVVGVEQQAIADGVGTYVVESAPDRDVRTELFQLAAAQQWRLFELRRLGLTLEEVFIRVVAGEQATALEESAE